MYGDDMVLKQMFNINSLFTQILIKFNKYETFMYREQLNSDQNNLLLEITDNNIKEKLQNVCSRLLFISSNRPALFNHCKK